VATPEAEDDAEDDPEAEDDPDAELVAGVAASSPEPQAVRTETGSTSEAIRTRERKSTRSPNRVDIRNAKPGKPNSRP
jgi:hypothetical protein